MAKNLFESIEDSLPSYTIGNIVYTINDFSCEEAFIPMIDGYPTENDYDIVIQNNLNTACMRVDREVFYEAITIIKKIGKEEMVIWIMRYRTVEDFWDIFHDEIISLDRLQFFYHLILSEFEYLFDKDYIFLRRQGELLYYENFAKLIVDIMVHIVEIYEIRDERRIESENDNY